MDVRDYEYIVAIADQGSVTRAAEQLFITQPALTKFLQGIEKELGHALFVRKGKQFILTEAGHRAHLRGHKFVVFQANTNSGHLTRELFRRYDIRPNTVLELNDVRSAIDTVANGIGASMFMSVAVGNQKVRYLSIKDIDIISQMVYLVYRNDLAMTAPMEYLSLCCITLSFVTYYGAVKKSHKKRTLSGTGPGGVLLFGAPGGRTF
ncbi:LysR family transcriptional regulator [Enterocloster clostridioformis]|uniref:LysR family transcriptional regulator n=1 Tax=Enterocloster clostridioformis TaxID=1531 RepID=UPI0026758947|nr:LysR family transcriptional regulator [Enterocloster clostridioformis]